MKHFVSGFAEEIMKLAYESWGMGADWSRNADQAVADGISPLMHEQSVPEDVEDKNMRQEHFRSRIMPPSSGKIREGLLGKPRFAAPDKEG